MKKATLILVYVGLVFSVISLVLSILIYNGQIEVEMEAPKEFLIGYSIYGIIMSLLAIPVVLKEKKILLATFAVFYLPVLPVAAVFMIVNYNILVRKMLAKKEEEALRASKKPEVSIDENVIYCERCGKKGKTTLYTYKTEFMEKKINLCDDCLKEYESEAK